MKQTYKKQMLYCGKACKALSFFIIFTLVFSLQSTAQVKTPEAIISHLQTEIQRSMELLKKKEIPPYYISCRCFTRDEYKINHDIYGLTNNHRNDREVYVTVRIGSPQFDNFSLLCGVGATRGHGAIIAFIPLEDDERSTRQAICEAINQAYQQALDKYTQAVSQKAQNINLRDTLGYFTEEKPTYYYEKPKSIKDFHLDINNLEAQIVKLAQVFKQEPDIIKGNIHAKITMNRDLLVASDGTVVAQNKPSLRIITSISGITPKDNTNIPLSKDYYGQKASQLPSYAQMSKDLNEMTALLKKILKAPQDDTYNGPILLGAKAAGVFFHEFFGHRMEGARMKSAMNGQTFLNKTNEQVLPEEFSVVFDPTISSYKGLLLSGSYKYDDEGIKGERVETIKDGQLKHFLMSRVPIKGFLHSNGHGRGEDYIGTETRQSNMIITSSHPKSEKELRQQMRELLIKQKKEYGYYIEEVSGGITQTGTFQANSFNVTPTITYRIYADGRPDELVRGVSLIGTPLNAFSQIIASGNQPAVFNGTCGASSGQIPVACVAPAILLQSGELQKMPVNTSMQHTLPQPKQADPTDETDPILAGMEQEFKRFQEQFPIKDNIKPFFIQAQMNSGSGNFGISATNGKLFYERDFGICNVNIKILVGDYKRCNIGFKDGNYPFIESRLMMEHEMKNADALNIRKLFWITMESEYNKAVNQYKSKINDLASKPVDPEEMDLPDFMPQKPIVFKEEITLPQVDRKQLKKRITEASLLLSQLLDKDSLPYLKSQVHLSVNNNIIHYYNTEGTRCRLFRPNYQLTLEAHRIDDNQKYYFSRQIQLDNLNNWPTDSLITQKCLSLIKEMKAIAQAKKTKIKPYFGPVLLENEAVSSILNPQQFIVNKRSDKEEQEYMKAMIHEKIASKTLSLYSLRGSKIYKGIKLPAYTPIDNEGVPCPEVLPLIKNGVLSNLFVPRTPINKELIHSTGQNNQPGQGYSLLMKVNTLKNNDELRSMLIEKAKKEHLKYAYIISSKAMQLYTGEAYLATRINVETGEEEEFSYVTLRNKPQIIRQISAGSNQEYIYITNNNTFITPQAILINEADLMQDKRIVRNGGVINHVSSPF